MSRWILLGLSALIGFVVVLAPAHVVASMAASSSAGRVMIDAPEGTLWSGSGTLTLQLDRRRAPVPLGRLEWRSYPIGPTTLNIDWRLTDRTHQLNGDLSIGSDAFAVTIDGTMSADVLDPFLAPYHIDLSGKVDFDAVGARLEHRDIQALEGSLAWSGGEVVYRLSGRTHRVDLGPMTARANETSEGVSIVAKSNDDLVMMQARLDNAGWLHVGITRHFLEAVGQPWKGDGRDAPQDEMVVEVSEKIL